MIKLYRIHLHSTSISNFFWRSNDGLRRLFQPGLNNTEMGEKPGSSTREEGDVGIVWGVRDPKGECGSVTGVERRT